MPKFITRVELHGATWQDYDNLHQQMEARGFSRIIVADDGQRYHLPTAEYVCTMNATPADVHARALQAAVVTGKPSSIIACQYDGCSFTLPVA